MMACFLPFNGLTQVKIQPHFRMLSKLARKVLAAGRSALIDSSASSARGSIGRFSAATLALLLLVAAGCATTQPRVVGYTDGPYDLTTVLPGDVINVSFPGAPTLNAQVKVTVDGEVRLPAAFGNTVNATGRTRAELEKALLEEFGSQLTTPEVNVSVVASSAVIYVSGAVLAPTKIAMDRPLTLLEAVMEAGGPDTRRAKLENVSVVRNFQGEQRTFVIDMRNAFRGGEVIPFYLRPFDSIVVPARTFNF
jgi:polysaccharide biosynthesis/export protein